MRGTVTLERTRLQIGCAALAAALAHGALLSEWFVGSRQGSAAIPPHAAAVMVRFLDTIAIPDDRGKLAELNASARADTHPELKRASTASRAPEQRIPATSPTVPIESLSLSLPHRGTDRPVIDGHRSDLPIYPEVLSVRVPESSLGDGPRRATLVLETDNRGRVVKVLAGSAELPQVFLESALSEFSETRFGKVAEADGSLPASFSAEVVFVSASNGTR